ncbi:hypothetical protein HO173_008272 [Letharia columbiana]|uniref:Uncharacterized protein n=1 Tax=Letharia columbiana TaxID=112416 RepID=A0A8H6FRT6_9LECA|nr:uncharacterized protein HO173_008272 [Letharia columbiana]KAF6233541.1 hypothetical protein HO173_008272 [Letharia columbiana]
MATGTDPAKRLRFDLFTKHVDNTHSEACYQMAFNTFDSFPTSLPNQRKGWNEGWIFDGKSMGDTGQIYSDAPRPGCQQVLEDNTCMRWIFFNSTEGIWQEDWTRRRTRRILLARRQDMANISRISEGQCGYGTHSTVKTSMRPGKTSDMMFLNELKPSDVFDYYHYTSAKSSLVEAYTDYGCLEIQGKQWACISGLPAMGAMAIERGG